MSLLDVALVLAALVIVLLHMRQDTGRSLLNAVAVIAAAAFCPVPAAALTRAARLMPFPGSEVAPAARAICFLALCVTLLLGAMLLHRHTRWTMDQWDPMFGVVFGLLIATTTGHIVTDVIGSTELMRNGRLPGYFAHSLLGEELRSFKTYRLVLSTFKQAQRRPGQ